MNRRRLLGFVLMVLVTHAHCHTRKLCGRDALRAFFHSCGLTKRSARPAIHKSNRVSSLTRMIEELQAQIVGDSDSNELTQQKSPLQIVNWDLIEQDFLPKQYLTAKIRSKRSHHHHHSRQRTLTAYRPVAPPKVTLRILLDRCCRYGCNPHVYLRQACNY